MMRRSRRIGGLVGGRWRNRMFVVGIGIERFGGRGRHVFVGRRGVRRIGLFLQRFRGAGFVELCWRGFGLDGI